MIFVCEIIDISQEVEVIDLSDDVDDVEELPPPIPSPTPSPPPSSQPINGLSPQQQHRVDDIYNDLVSKY